MKSLATIFVIILLVVVVIIYQFNIKGRGAFVELKYIITETGMPDSFDPLNADKTQNISVMRMLYSTPIEISSNNNIYSNILSEFAYDPTTFVITFTLKENLLYSDDSIIKPNDLALAIARMAYVRSDFPVIKDIVGIQKWASSKNGLNTFPEGIEVDDNKVSIKLNKRNSNPLFRFCLELFSVIPESCIDLNTAQIKCERPPSSGYFEINAETDKKIVFSKRELSGQGYAAINYNKIIFNYKSLFSACSEEIDANTIISATEIDYIASNCKQLITLKQTHWMPSSRFAVLRFNPNVAPFADNDSRQCFTETVRKVLKKNNPDLLVERGLFSNLLPGFVASEKIANNCSTEFEKRFADRIIFFPKKVTSGFKVIYETLIEAATFLRMKIEYVDNSSADEVVGLFVNGKLGVIAGASGFWAQDPVGDISMWFTPNLHKTMTFAWADKEIYNKIRELEDIDDPVILNEKMIRFNKYISEQSVLIPFLHFRRLFISSKHIETVNLPQAVTSPAPWQIVPVN